MYIVSYKYMGVNAANYSYAMQRSASTLHEAIGYIPFSMEIKSNKRHIFDVSNEDCSFEFTVILSKNYIIVVFQSISTRVYDYSHSEEAIEFIKIMGSLTGHYSFEEDG